MKLNETSIKYLYDMNVRSDVTIEELAEDIMADVDEVYGMCPECGFPIARGGEQND